MKIYTLECKGEILAMLTHKENITYRDFRNICTEVSQEVESDFYALKDILVNEQDFELVELAGGIEVSKKKGAF